MDLLTILIGISLVLVGAFFIGYPVGTIIGARRVRDEIKNGFDLPVIVLPARIERDVLNDEFVTESYRYFAVIKKFCLRLDRLDRRKKQLQAKF